MLHAQFVRSFDSALHMRLPGRLGKSGQGDHEGRGRGESLPSQIDSKLIAGASRCRKGAKSGHARGCAELFAAKAGDSWRLRFLHESVPDPAPQAARLVQFWPRSRRGGWSPGVTHFILRATLFAASALCKTVPGGRCCNSKSARFLSILAAGIFKMS